MHDTEQLMEPVQTFTLSVTVNGNVWNGDVPVEEVLLDFLRIRLRLTGSKRSCNSEVCGACTVLVESRPVSACNYLVFEANGRDVTTIEGLERGAELDPIQTSFVEQVAAQCGFCTPGQIMAVKALLLENPKPTYAEMAEWMRGNICRCGTYPAIARAVMQMTDGT
jgi:aerobic carbon-monoxide dehydrogenase small subunit